MNDSITSRRRGGKSDGFTLVEILVACAVLVVLVILVSQMVSSASLVTKQSSRRMDADDEARMVFDRMAGDFDQMLKRNDTEPLFLGMPGNDALYFYSQAPALSTNLIGGSTNNSQIALIGYEVMSNGLARLGVEQSWDGLSYSTNALTNLLASGEIATNFHIIAPSVFRMEFALHMRPGSTNNTNGLGPVPDSYGGSPTTNGTNTYYQTNNAGQALGDIADIVVAIAILDQTSQEIVTPEQLSNLADVSIMQDSATNGIPADTWMSNALQASGIPPAARSQIRVYQRSFPITP